MRFRILNSTPLYDYREACKVTKGIDLKEGEILDADRNLDEMNAEIDEEQKSRAPSEGGEE